MGAGDDCVTMDHNILQYTQHAVTLDTWPAQLSSGQLTLVSSHWHCSTKCCCNHFLYIWSAALMTECLEWQSIVLVAGWHCVHHSVIWSLPLIHDWYTFYTDISDDGNCHHYCKQSLHSEASNLLKKHFPFSPLEFILESADLVNCV